MLLFSVGNGTMNVLRYWQRRDDVYTLYRLRDKISAITPRVSYPYGAMNFMPALAIGILIANICTRWRVGIFKALPQDGGQTDFFENIHAYPFHKELSNETLLARSISLDCTFTRVPKCLFLNGDPSGAVTNMY
jgi:hypothetical protein